MIEIKDKFIFAIKNNNIRQVKIFLKNKNLTGSQKSNLYLRITVNKIRNNHNKKT
jgi:hypothetical protein